MSVSCLKVDMQLIQNHVISFDENYTNFSKNFFVSKKCDESIYLTWQEKRHNITKPDDCFTFVQTFMKLRIKQKLQIACT
jgi:hypothetical protein